MKVRLHLCLLALLVPAGAWAQALATEAGVVGVSVQGGAPATLSVDAATRGPLPWSGGLTAGTHRFEVHGETGDVPPFDLEVRAGETLDVTVELEPHRVPVAVVVPPPPPPPPVSAPATEPPPPPPPVSAPATEPPPPPPPVSAPATEPPPPPPPVSAPATEPPPPPPPVSRAGGFYVGLAPVAGMPLGGQVRIPCDDAEVCVDTVAVQLGGAVHGGYAFGPVAVELLLSGEYEQYERHRRFNKAGALAERASDPGVKRLEAFKYTTTTAFGGVGARGAFGEGLVRFTTGATLGVVYRAQSLERDLSQGVQDSMVRSFSSAGPGARLDAGLLVGRAGGVSGHIGAWFRADLPVDDARTQPDPNDGVVPSRPDVVPLYSTPAYTLTDGAQFAAGLALGVTYGL